MSKIVGKSCSTSCGKAVWAGALLFVFFLASHFHTLAKTAAKKAHPSPCGELCSPSSPEDAGLLRRIASIRNDCGELCDGQLTSSTQGMFFPSLRKPVNCNALFENEYLFSPSPEAHAPRRIPIDLLDDFSMHGSAALHDLYFDQKYAGESAKNPDWTLDYVNSMVARAHRGALFGTYGRNITEEMRHALREADVSGKHALVIGSENHGLRLVCWRRVQAK